MIDNRVRLVFVSFRVWLDSMMRGQAVRCVNLPREAKVVFAAPCTDRFGQDVVLWLASPDFEPVPDCGVIPEFRLEFELRETQLAAMRRSLLIALSGIEEKAGRLLEFGADMDKVDISDIMKMARAGIDAASPQEESHAIAMQAVQ